MRTMKLLMIARYLTLLLLFIPLFSSPISLGAPSIIICLLLVINSQLRFFTLQKKLYLRLSLVADLLLIFILSTSYLLPLNFYYLLPVMDTILLLSRREHPVFFLLFCLTALLQKHPFHSMDFIIQLVILLIFATLSYHIREEREKKLDAQKLYDEIRISEKQLKTAKDELELCAASLTELAVLKERNRISREIHDSIGHALSTAIIQLNAMEVISAQEQSRVTQHAQQLREFLKGSLEEVRCAVENLKPENYHTYRELYRVQDLIQNFETLTGIRVHLNLSTKKWELHEKIGQTLYRTIQEALSNALRHGQATEVYLTLNFLPDHLILIIHNNGQGCPILTPGIGLTSMKERIEEVGGNITFFPSENGFKIQALIPRRKDNIYD